MSATMTFKFNDGQMTLIEKRRDILRDMNNSLPLSTAFIVDMPRIKESIKTMDFLKGKSFVVAPAVGVVSSGSGVFWDVFLTYIFPWLLDIAKVYCAIQIARAFYEEKRGGKDGGSGFGALVGYGKWLLLFHLLPFGVELIDQIGEKMWNDLKTTKIR